MDGGALETSREVQEQLITAARECPRTHGQKSRSGSTVGPIPAFSSYSGKPPVKGLPPDFEGGDKALTILAPVDQLLGVLDLLRSHLQFAANINPRCFVAFWFRSALVPLLVPTMTD